MLLTTCCCDCAQKAFTVVAWRHGFPRLGTNDANRKDVRRWKTKTISFLNEQTGLYIDTVINIGKNRGVVTYTETTNMSDAQVTSAMAEIDSAFASAKSGLGSGDITSFSTTIAINPAYDKIMSVALSDENTEDIQGRMETLLNDYALDQLSSIPEGKRRIFVTAPPEPMITFRSGDLGLLYAVTPTSVGTSRHSDIYSFAGPLTLTDLASGETDDVEVISDDYDWTTIGDGSCSLVEETISLSDYMAQTFGLVAAALGGYGVYAKEGIYFGGRNACVAWDLYTLYSGSGTSAKFCEDYTGVVITPDREFYYAGSPSSNPVDTIYAVPYGGLVTIGGTADGGSPCECSLAP